MSKKNRYLKIYINGDLYRTTGACSRQFRETLYHYGVVATRYGMGYKYKNYNPYIRGVLQSKFRDAAYINSIGYIEEELIGKNKTIVDIKRPKIRIDVIRNSDIAMNYKAIAQTDRCPEANCCYMRSKFVEQSYFPKVNFLLITSVSGNGESKCIKKYIISNEDLDYLRSVHSDIFMIPKNEDK